MTTETLSALMDDVRGSLSGDQMTIGQLLDLFHERGLAFVLLFFAAPMALPIPVPPGVNVLLASPLIILTAQLALGRPTLWMPEKLKRRGIGRDKLEKVMGGIIPWLRRIEFMLRPRLTFMTVRPVTNIVGVMALIMALTICIPVPLTNTVPSLGIAIVALGLLMRDGLAVLVGCVLGSLWVAGLAFLGHAGLKALLEAMA